MINLIFENENCFYVSIQKNSKEFSIKNLFNVVKELFEDNMLVFIELIDWDIDVDEILKHFNADDYIFVKGNKSVFKGNRDELYLVSSEKRDIDIFEYYIARMIDAEMSIMFLYNKDINIISLQDLKKVQKMVYKLKVDVLDDCETLKITYQKKKLH